MTSGREEPLAVRFWRFVVRGTTDDDCWGWVGATQHPGYGRIGVGGGGNVGFAHRVSWELHNGPTPNGLFVLHRCDNPPCTNPRHLFLGTQQENLKDMTAKGRNANKPAIRCRRGLHPMNAEHARSQGPQGRYCATCRRMVAQGELTPLPRGGNTGVH